MNPAPPGYRYQLSSESFDFSIITDTQNFQRYQKHAKDFGLIRDICDPKLNDVQHVPINDYLNIEQKSPTWLRFRAKADGTASSVGKKIKGSTTYPTMNQVSEAWEDALTNKPFEVTHTMAGHMKWGVDYEDPALIHFAVDNMLSVAAVGTIHLPLRYVLDLIPNYFKDTFLNEISEDLCKICPSEAHLLVSPDGLVGTPDRGEYENLPTNLVGMLEIKCISPFHHVEEDGTLSWVDEMEKRQWYNAGQIPYVYVVQICLQAISGLYRLNMTDEDTMWFIRWSPNGFSEFKIPFKPLVKMGIVAIMLYFKLKYRLTLDQLPLQYNANEQKLAHILHQQYKTVTDMMEHRYVNHSRLYPEFNVYQKCTKQHRFVVLK
jgi:hypothetical protein